jgi:hypothetical protein
MQVDRVVSIDYAAPEHVRDAIASLAQTEDVKFSPASRRLAIASLLKNEITVFGISMIRSGGSIKITLTDATEISSKYLNGPHGLDFIDEGKIIVANRHGNPCIFELPNETGSHELLPLAVLRSKEIVTPTSVAIIENGHGVYEALICNNDVQTVSRHRLDFSSRFSTSSDVLLKKGLDAPDCICVSRERQWIALSNHYGHDVFVYKNTSLNEYSDPVGILRGVCCPHGLRFTSDGRFILVSDCTTPYVNIYQKDDLDWEGVRYPLLSFRVLDDEDFLRGKRGYEEGGAKGIDIDDATNVIVTTCEMQPLAFFDLGAILEDACEGKSISNYSLSKSLRRKQRTLDVSRDLEIQELELCKRIAAEKASMELRAVMNSLSWRITAPVRELMAKVRRLRSARLAQEAEGASRLN